MSNDRVIPRERVIPRVDKDKDSSEKVLTKEEVLEKEIYELAKKRLTIKKNFFTHLGCYCVVNSGLLILSLTLFGSMIPLLVVGTSWGIGLGCHYISAVSNLKLDNKDIKLLEREVEFIKSKMLKDE